MQGEIQCDTGEVCYAGGNDDVRPAFRPAKSKATLSAIYALIGVSNILSPVIKYHIGNGGMEMKLMIGIQKGLIALVLAIMLIVPALAMSAEAQLYGSQYSQIGSGSYPSSQYIAGGDMFRQQCQPGYYYDTYARQCVPIQQQYPGGPQSCPNGYYYDQYRQQCVPYMTTQQGYV